MSTTTAARTIKRASSISGVRLAVRVPIDLRVVVARPDGEKVPARIRDLSLRGMHVEASTVPDYGEAVRIVAQFGPRREWLFLPARVRWFSGTGFGVEFTALDGASARALARFVETATT